MSNGKKIPSLGAKSDGFPSSVIAPVEQQQSSTGEPEPEPPHQRQPHDANPTPERPSIWTRIQESWITEFVALIVSAGAIAAIAGLLSKYNEQQLPSWDGVSLNSLVSWLTTAAGICMGYVAGTSIAQLKWVWFAQEARKMEDMRLFNAAGGVAGALELLLKLRVRHFAVVTLLAVILAIGLDPFSQNLIGFYEHDVVDANQAAMVTRGRWYDTLGPRREYSAYTTNPILKANVNNAIVNLGQSTNASLPEFICNTGNCTYPPFATLAYQAACSDLSDKINKNCSETSCDVTIRGSELGLTYSTVLSSFSLMTTQAFKPSDAVVYTDASSSAAFSSTVFQALRVRVSPYLTTDGSNPHFNNNTETIAQECIITPCVRSIEASVRHGVYAETVLDTYVEFEEPDSTQQAQQVLRPPWGPDKGVQPGDDNMFGVSWDVEYSMSYDEYPQSILGNVSLEDVGSGLSFSNDQVQSIWFADVSALGACPFTIRGQKESFSCAINAVADAYTQTVRDAGYVANGTASSDSLVRGETLVIRTFIRVQWPWIALHVAVWLLTAVSWVGTVWRTKNLGIPFWRSDPMPMVYMFSAALQQQGQAPAQESRSTLGMDMETGGDDILMRLRNEDGHMRLVREL